MNYQVGDFIIRLKNAALARRRTTLVSFSKNNKAIADIMIKEGFLSSIKEDTQEGKKVFVIGLAYENRTPVISDVLLFSKPSLRVYQKAKNIKKLQKRGFDLEIISTSLGIMSVKEAKKKGIGGELLFKVW